MTHDIALHLGVHKTASTHLQNLFAQNYPLLIKRGIYFFGPNEIRQSITMLSNKLSGGNHAISQNDLTSAIDQLPLGPNAKRVIISDENLIGSPRDIFSSGTIYPNALNQLKTFGNSLSHKIVKNIFVCLRSYDQYIPSSYCEMIRHYDYCTFNEYVQNFDHKRHYWIELIDSVHSVFTDANIFVWEFASYNESLARIVNEIADAEIYTELNALNTISRPSQSAKSIEIRSALIDVLSRQEIKKIGKKIDTEFPKNSENGTFGPYSEIEISYLKSKHELEMAEIRRMPFVKFID